VSRQAAAVQIRLDVPAAALVLYLSSPQGYPQYRVEIQAASGKTSSPAVAAPISPQSILVLLTYRQLAPGDYRIRVFGVESGQTKPVEEYPFRVLAP